MSAKAREWRLFGDALAANSGATCESQRTQSGDVELIDRKVGSESDQETEGRIVDFVAGSAKSEADDQDAQENVMVEKEGRGRNKSWR
ncbi:MAG: hypothetical protein M4579_001901 [Chaenotheca gracillima]|nr:MAG: hypothetical protein M4579_001901 [Chaenotheca gracillima]